MAGRTDFDGFVSSTLTRWVPSMRSRSTSEDGLLGEVRNNDLTLIWFTESKSNFRRKCSFDP